MKEERIANLLKESMLKTSDGFTDQLITKIVTRQLQRMRLKLIVLVGVVIACFDIGAWVLFKFGFQIDAFGISLELPEIGSLVIMGVVGSMTLLHLSNLLRMTSVGNS